MRATPVALALAVLPAACDGGAQQRPARPPAEPLPACEWCGAAEAPAALTSEATLAPAGEPGTRLVVTGVVYRGRTPAPGVLVYAYHTNAAGVYPRRGDETGNARRHGYLRGWLRTDARGRYRLVTIRPGSYPSRDAAAHIHLTVTPPGGEERWIDSIVFDDDPLLTAEGRRAAPGRGGSGVVRARRGADGALHATRDIVLDAGDAGDAAAAGGADSLAADVARSVVRWKGTKFRGLGKHEGTVRLAGGALALCGARVCGGRFAIDMRSIAVTDIPAHEPVPRARLTRHLMHPDFFWVDRYPAAEFRLREVRPAGGARYDVRGELTLRGVTRPVAFAATLEARTADEVRVGARLAIDRQRWGVAYRGSRLTNDLVDDEIALDLTLVARRPAAAAPRVAAGRVPAPGA